MGYISGLTVNPLSSVLRNYLITGYYPLTKHQLDFCVQTMRWEAIIRTLRYTAREKWTQTEQRPLTVTSLSCSSSLAFSSVNILSAALCSAFCSLWLWPWSSSKFWPVLFCCVATQSSRGEVLWGKKTTESVNLPLTLSDSSASWTYWTLNLTNQQAQQMHIRAQINDSRTVESVYRRFHQRNRV